MSKPAGVPRRRRWWLVALGAAIVAGSILGVHGYVNARNESMQVLVTVRDVAWNHRLSSADLAVAVAIPDTGVRMIPADQRDLVVGRSTNRSLIAGTLVAEEHLAERPVPQRGEVLVGLLLKPGQLPARGLRSEDEVLLMAMSTGGAGRDSDTSVRGRVVDVGAVDPNGAVPADVLVADDHAKSVTAAAATGHLVVSLVGPSR